MVKTIKANGHNVIISDNNIIVMFGVWSWSAWMNGRKDLYNSIKPDKPLNQMTTDELKKLAVEAVIAGKKEKERLDKYFASLGRKKK